MAVPNILAVQLDPNIGANIGRALAQRQTRNYLGGALSGDAEAQAELMRRNPELGMQAQGYLAQSAQASRERKLMQQKQSAAKVVQSLAPLQSVADPNQRAQAYTQIVSRLKQEDPELDDLPDDPAEYDLVLRTAMYAAGDDYAKTALKRDFPEQKQISAEGQPFEAMRGGKPVLVQRYSDGSLKPVEGLSPKEPRPSVNLQIIPDPSSPTGFSYGQPRPGQEALPPAGAKEKRDPVLDAANKKRLQELDAAAQGAQNAAALADQAEALINAGVYEASPTDRAAMAAHAIGLNDSPEASNTDALKTIGAQLVLSKGSLGAGVSVYDAQTYAKAAGDFQNAKNNSDRRKAIKIMRDVAVRAVNNANTARSTYEETGRLPQFEAPASAASGPEFIEVRTTKDGRRLGKRADGTIVEIK